MPNQNKSSMIQQNRASVRSARRWSQYCQLPAKNSGDISRDIWNSSQYFQCFVYLLQAFSRNPNWETQVYRVAQLVDMEQQQRENVLPSPEIDPRSVGRSARSKITIPTELPLHPKCCTHEYKINHSIEYIPSWQASSYSTSQKFLEFYGTRGFIFVFTTAQRLA